MPGDDVLLKLARELFGGDPPGLLNFLGFEGQQVGEQWLVRTAEAAAGTKSDLVSVTALYAENAGQGQYDWLAADRSHLMLGVIRDSSRAQYKGQPGSACCKGERTLRGQGGRKSGV